MFEPVIHADLLDFVRISVEEVAVVVAGHQIRFA